jgi:hypothetical protein
MHMLETSAYILAFDIVNVYTGKNVLYQLSIGVGDHSSKYIHPFYDAVGSG